MLQGAKLLAINNHTATVTTACKSVGRGCPQIAGHQRDRRLMFIMTGGEGGMLSVALVSCGAHSSQAVLVCIQNKKGKQMI
jgi:hypothetical protein